MDDVAFALVEFPVTDQPRRLRVNVVHVLPDLLLGAGHVPDANLGDVAVQLARVVVGLAEEELTEIAPALVLFILDRILQVEVVESPACQIERRRGGIDDVRTAALQLAV